jgi:hypothetical protein
MMDVCKHARMKDPLKQRANGLSPSNLNPTNLKEILRGQVSSN